MRVSAILAATASADVYNFVVDNFWDEAVKVFNFAETNWDQFANAANSVPDSHYAPLWEACNTDGDAYITQEEFFSFGAKVATYFGISETSQDFLYNFGTKYWHVLANGDDADGVFSYDEFKYAMAGFAATDAGLAIKDGYFGFFTRNQAFDENGNGILEGQELTAWRVFMQQLLSSNNWNPSQDDFQAVRNVWFYAQVDGDEYTASRVEISRFVIGIWNLLLQ